MQKIYTNNSILHNLTLVKENEISSVMRLGNGDFLKIFNPELLRLIRLQYNLEEKIMSAHKIVNVPEILTPKAGVYDNASNNIFLGYITDPAKGVNFNDFDNAYSIKNHSNLTGYTKIMCDLFNIVERANKNNIIFPDLCTCDNLFIHNGQFSFIDYDGIQIDKYKVLAISSSLGNNNQYFVPKFFKNGLFTTELDKKSMLILYFLTVFNIDLNSIGRKVPYTGEIVSLKVIFDTLGLEDDIFFKKASDILSPTKNGDYIIEDIIRIDRNYEMHSIAHIGDRYIKKLVKKSH